jgi:hypothetical protein
LCQKPKELMEGLIAPEYFWNKEAKND